MSLTNPEKVVTTEMLQEYHESILPYLGGMPAIVANKFSKGDLYSTDEKMIGCLEDGKPLYQKSYTGTLSGSYDTERTLIDNSLLPQNIDLCYVDIANSYVEYPNAGYRSAVFIYSTTSVAIWYSGQSIKIKTSALSLELNNGKYRVVIRYTKTTDEPISIGDGSDYSTEEKVIGTWIDGKPLYQKTVSKASSASDLISGTNDIIVVSGSEHLNLIHAYGCIKKEGHTAIIPYNYDLNYGLSIYQDEDGNIRLNFSTANNGTSFYWEGTYYITLHYTKTTN